MFKRIFFALGVLLSALASSGNDQIYVLPVADNEIKIMTYNVENLFDAKHDEGKKDFEFLPAKDPEKAKCKEDKRYAEKCANLDWTEEKVVLKIKQIKKVLAAQGVIPDVLALVEVENKAVVQQLAKALGYGGVLITESPDQRGIDCAILYNKKRLRLIEYIDQPIEKALFPTRNLSAAVFQAGKSVGEKTIIVSPNHWPSQGNTGLARRIVAERAVQFYADLQIKYMKADPHFIVLGDFNTLPNESPNPLNEILLGREAKVRLVDAHESAKLNKSPAVQEMPIASYYYPPRNEWTEFDHIFVSENLMDQTGLEMDTNSFRILAPSFLTIKNGNGEPAPKRYNHNTKNVKDLGYSDHFGLVVKLRL